VATAGRTGSTGREGCDTQEGRRGAGRQDRPATEREKYKSAGAQRRHRCFDGAYGRTEAGTMQGGRTEKVSSTGPGRPTQSGAFAGGRRSREAERGERPDRGGRAGHAGKPPSDARGSGGRRYQHGFGGGTDPRPRERDRLLPCFPAALLSDRTAAAGRAPQLKTQSRKAAEANIFCYTALLHFHANDIM